MGKKSKTPADSAKRAAIAAMLKASASAGVKKTPKASKPSKTTTSSPSPSHKTSVKTQKTPPKTSTAAGGDLRSKALAKLSGGAFRWINEQLYTTPASSAVELFAKDRSLFKVYHDGFSMQTESWSVNPVDVYIDRLTRSKQPQVVGDFGCGDAKLGQTLSQSAPRHTTHSFDLVANHPSVIEASIDNVPLQSDVLDVVVFSLSLMGTNYLDFIREAWRTLKSGGKLWIAEVASRVSTMDHFVSEIESVGFKSVAVDLKRSKYFVLLDFVKMTKPKPGKPVHSKGGKNGKKGVKAGPALGPCIYKRR